MKLIRKKRLQKVLLIILGASVGIFLILYSLNNKLDYFYTASDFKNANFSENRRVKLGGMVLEGSVKQNKDGIIFSVTDYKETVNVYYAGIVPDLFKEGSGVVALGYINKDILIADQVLAKHDENYMPPQID
tara:strand:+ start:895 stop:1290 length:396 start_codon:yes stop_codon:yes gene_type:complete